MRARARTPASGKRSEAERATRKQDLELDIWVPDDGPWRWKDVGLLEQRAAEGRFTDEQVRSVRASAEQVAADLDAGRRWWDDDLRK